MFSCQEESREKLQEDQRFQTLLSNSKSERNNTRNGLRQLLMMETLCW